jgi:hypothetical protein
LTLDPVSRETEDITSAAELDQLLLTNIIQLIRRTNTLPFSNIYT